MRRSILLFVFGFGLVNLSLPVQGQEFGAPDLQRAMCQNNWPQALQIANRLIARSETSASDRESLARLRYQLQDWRATRARVNTLPGCETVATPEETALTYTAPTSLNFQAAVRSIQEAQRIQPGTAPASAQLGITSPRGCWVIDRTGQRIDLSAICRGR